MSLPVSLTLKLIATSFRSWIRHTWLTVVMLGCIAFLMSGTLRANQFDTLRLYWQDQLTGTNLSASTLTGYAKTATNYWNTINTNSSRTYLWSDLPLGSSSAYMSSTFGRLQSMALAWASTNCPLQTNAALGMVITNALDWLCANVYKTNATEYFNWWDWEIGSLQALNNIVVLMYPGLTPAQITNYNNSVDYFGPNKLTGGPGIAPNNGWMTGANLTDQCKGMIIRGITGQDASKLSKAQTNLSPVFLYVTTGDGFYRDGSFIQHNTHPYAGGYGAVALTGVAQLVDLLYGSTWQITDPNWTNVFNWVFQSFEPVIYKGEWMAMVCGRGISRGPASSSSASIVNRVARIAPPDTAAAIYRWSASPSMPPGQYHFASMDQVVAWRSNFCAGLSMSSSRISNYESINGENLHGWFTGDGMLYLYLGNPDTQFTGDFWPTVDAYHLPGTTVQTSARANSAGQSQATGQPWVGGVQVGGQYGSAGMALAAYGTTLTAKKSWFMFDNQIVCLGAGITCGDAADVDTTVENRRLGTTPNNNFTVNGVANPPVMGWSSNLTGVTWCALDGVAGYYFPGGATNLQAAFMANTGSWSQINDGSHIAADTNYYTDDYLKLWFNHGIKPTNASYAYVILPNYTAGDMADYAASPDIVMLTNTVTVQAASQPGLGVVAANFWVDGTNSADLITANKKSAVITLETARGISVGIADPTQTNSGTVSVTLNRPAVLTVAVDPGVTVVQLSPKIILSVNVSGSLGKTYQASFLYSPVTMTWDADSTSTGAQDGSGNWDKPGTNWWNSAGDISWNDAIASIATFGAGGTAGTVMLTNAHTAFALAFNPVGSGAYTLAGTGPLTISNGITVNASATVGVPLNLTASQIWTVAGNQTLNVTGAVSAPGAVSLSLAGGGTLILSGSNTNSGPITVNAGTLLVNGNLQACTNTVTISSGAVFGGTGTNGGSVILNAGGQLAPGGLSSVGTLTLTNNLTLNNSTLFFALATNAPGTNDLVAVGNRLNLNGANSVVLSVSSMIPAGNYTLMTFAGGYTGTGTFALGGSLTNNASLQLNANSLVLQVGAGGIYVFTDTWKGYASGTWNASALNWTNGSPIVPYQNNDAVIFDDTLVKNPVISNATPAAVVSPGSVTFNNNLTNYLIKANIGGTNLLVKSGAATVALTGTNTYTGNTTINGGTLVVTNGGTINSPLATLNIGAQAGTAGTLILFNGTSAITVQTLLATNVACDGHTSNSVFNINGGTLVTSNGTGGGYAAAILLASNVSWNLNGNWTMNGGTNLVGNVATNFEGSASGLAVVYAGNGVNNVRVNVNPNAVWWLAIPANSVATNTLELVVGNGNATNNVVTVNNGALIVTNLFGRNPAVIAVGNSPGSAGNQLVITNGGQVFTKAEGNGGPTTGNIGNSTGPNNSLVVGGTNAAGRKATWDFAKDRLSIGIGNGSNSWALVNQGGVLTNVTVFTYNRYSRLIITNGGQIFPVSCTIGRAGINNSLVIAGADAAGNPATLAFPTAGTLTVGGGSGTPTLPAPGTDTVVLVGTDGLITNAAIINVGQDTNSVRNALVITNGGQVFSTGNSAIGYVAGCNSNSATVGGGAGMSLWDLGNTNLTIGNSAAATNNFATLFTGGVLTNVSSVILGGVNSRFNFNGGTLAAGADGNWLNTNSSALNAVSYVQAGGAVMDSVDFSVTNVLPLLSDPGSPGGGLTKLGSGVLTLLGANTYSGNTTVSAGTLLVNGNSSGATNTVTVTSGAGFGGLGTVGGCVVVNSGGLLVPGGADSVGKLTLTSPLTLNGGGLFFKLANNGNTNDQVAVGGVLTVNGVSTIYLTGAAPVGTNTLMTFGSLTGSGSFVLEVAPPNIFLLTNGNSLQLAVTNAFSAGLIWKGYQTGVWDDAVNKNWLGGAAVNFTPGDTVVFDDTLVANSTVSSGSPVQPGSVTINNSLTNYNISATIGGTGTVTKSGTAMATLTGANSFSGGVTLQAGTLVVGNAGALGAGSLELNGGTLSNSVNLALTNAVNLSGAATLGVGIGVTNTITGALTNVGSLNLMGPGTVILAGNNSFSGGLTIGGGTNNLNSATVLGTGVFTINGGMLDNKSGATISNVNNNVQIWNSNFTFIGSSALNLGNGAVALNNSVTITGVGGVLVVGGNMSGSGSLTHNGGNLVLSGNLSFSGGLTNIAGWLTNSGLNTYPGPTSLPGGTNVFNSIANVGQPSALGQPMTADDGVIRVNSTLRYNGSNDCTSDRAFNWTGGTFYNDSTSTKLILTGGITNANNGGFTIRGTGTIVVNSLISIGSGAVVRTDGGTAVLTNYLNQFSGNPYISDGKFYIDTIANSNAACSIGAGNFIRLGQYSGATTGTLQLAVTNGSSCNRDFFIQCTTTGGGLIENTVADTTVTLSGNITSQATNTYVTNLPALTLTGAGNGVLSGVVGINTNPLTTMAITKSGLGTWTISGLNTNRGLVTVSAGTLLINGDSSGATNTVTVATNASFGGTGTNGGNVTMSAGGILVPGGLDTVGKLTLTNKLTLNGSKLYFKVANTNGVGTNDLLAIGQALSVAGVNNIYLSGASPVGTNTLMTFGSISGTGSFALGAAYPNVFLITNGNSLQLAASVTAPSLSGSATFTNFITTYGLASAAQSFPVTGANLTSDITNTAAPGFEISTNGSGYGVSAVIPNAGGSASGTVYIRLAATATAGSYNASNIVVITSAGAASITNVSTISGNVVNPATPVLTVTASTITYGQTLTNVSLAGSVATNANNQAPVLGGFALMTATNMPNAGITNVTVNFTPLDTTNYTLSSTNVNITVTPASLVITVNSTNKVYDTTLTFGGGEFTSSGLVNGNVVTNVTLASSGASNAAPVGLYAITATNALGSGLTNYSISYSNGQLTVSQGAYTIAWTNPASISYGTALGTNQNAASASIAGNYNYNPTNGTVLPAGTNALQVTFTPTDTNYAATNLGVTLVVNPASLVITANSTNKVYSMALTFSDVEYTSSGLVNGNVVTNAALASSGASNLAPVGMYTITATNALGSGLTNYSISYSNGTLTVGQGIYNIVWTNPASISYGTALGTNQNAASASIAGNYNYNPTNGTVPPAGTNTLHVTFTPTDTNYALTNLSVQLVVNASSNAYLASLVLSPAGILSPGFGSNQFNYTATEAYSNAPTVTVINADLTAASRLIYGNTTNLLTSGVASAALALNPNPGVTNIVKVRVTAQDGLMELIYTVKVQRLPSTSPPTMTNQLSGTNLTLSWPLGHVGYRLLVQTNQLVGGISMNTNDWMVVPGSTLTNQVSLPVNQVIPSEYYKLVSP